MKAIARALQSVPFLGKLTEPLKPEILVTEGVSGMWHYHLSTRTQRTQGLSACGARVMSTEMDLADWKKPFGAHFPKRPTFCAQCERLHAGSLATAVVEHEDTATA